MNFNSIGTKHGIRLLLNGKPLTRRVQEKELLSKGMSAKEYVKREMNTLEIINCTVEVSKVNGTSFINPYIFNYSIQSSTAQLLKKPVEAQSSFHSNRPSEDYTYRSYEGFLAKHYEKWYDEEVEKNRKLRQELDQTRKELNTASNELQLLTRRTDIENKQKDFERERREMEWEREKERGAKSGLNGVMDTLSNNTFLQGLLEKVIDNFMRRNDGGLNGVPKVNNPEIQKEFTEVVNLLAKVTKDKGHFSYIALILNKVCSDKMIAQKLFAWLDNPTPPPMAPKVHFNDLPL